MTGGFCALLGVFIMTLPIPIVVNSFASYYKNRLWRNEVSMKKRERIREQVGSKDVQSDKRSHQRGWEVLLLTYCGKSLMRSGPPRCKSLFLMLHSMPYLMIRFVTV